MRQGVDLQSSIKEQGHWVTQIIHFVGGEKRTFEHIDSSYIKQGQFTKLITKDGRYILINDKNVLCIEVFTEHE
tara:strand:- start:975 stop:1196 length:222 start_codon:yes stop_codon:yes gene_type:complete